MDIAKTSGKAFTLIELMLGLAIVAVLVSLVLAMLPRASQTYKNAICVSNLRSLGQAVLNHAAENNGRSVVAYQDAAHSPTGVAQVWYMALIKDGHLDRDAGRRLLTCPSYAPYKYSETGNDSMYTYGLRRWNDEGGRSRFDPAISLGKGGTLSKSMLLADSYKPGLSRQFYYISWPGFTSSAPEQFHMRHQGRANICFGDGSVRNLNGDEILNLGDGWKASTIREE